MHLFKSGNFKEYYTKYPVGPINVGSDIFLQVSVTSSDSGLVVFVDERKATPLNEYNDPNQFIFLEDGLVLLAFATSIPMLHKLLQSPTRITNYE